MQLDSMQIVQQVMRMLPMGGDNASAFDLSGFSNSSADMILDRKGGDAPITFGIAIANFGIFHNCPNHMKDPLKDPLKAPLKDQWQAENKLNKKVQPKIVAKFS